MNYKLTISYDGSRYDGWQKQGNTDNTIQGKLEAVLSSVCGEEIEINGAGRTDAGVHAQGQCANFRSASPLSPSVVMEMANSYLPEDIAIISAEEAPERFHARLNAKGKTYRYSLRLGTAPDVFRRKYQLRIEDALDIEAMKKAAKALCGEHDYKAFCSLKKYKKSTVRNVESIELVLSGDNLDIYFRGDGFLYNMVRILTGTLIEVGTGKLAHTDMEGILRSLDRSKAGFTAPAKGLCLINVEY